MSVAVVAIPRNGDSVWDYSSEKIPHMTLLFLGDVLPGDKLGDAAAFIEHATNTMLRWSPWVRVAKRGLLGSGAADVLFFDERSTEQFANLRAALLKQPDIKKAYASTEQFDGWTPHLTLGYPDSPAKDAKKNYEFYGVQFDRIALWYGDYEGVEFEIQEGDDMAVAMSSISEAGADFLEHFGVKGMRWGHRRSRAERAAARQGKRTNPVELALSTDKLSKKARQDILAKRRTLSDDDLNQFLSRLEKEKKLKTLLQEDIAPGKAQIKKTLIETGDGLFKMAAKKYVEKALGVKLDKKFDAKTLPGKVAKESAEDKKRMAVAKDIEAKLDEDAKAAKAKKKEDKMAKKLSKAKVTTV